MILSRLELTLRKDAIWFSFKTQMSSPRPCGITMSLCQLIHQRYQKPQWGLTVLDENDKRDEEGLQVMLVTAERSICGTGTSSSYIGNQHQSVIQAPGGEPEKLHGDPAGEEDGSNGEHGEARRACLAPVVRHGHAACRLRSIEKGCGSRQVSSL